ncbi:MAG TPA: hypothetical protein VGS97_26120 [Actinocrinis sp.]|uniref:hypothetical protein n=1 Tax=Actinocrinis sp. TaxID=1920516 RepID=UPI002DDD1C57|nr:hypothetical protein [Actinocrinis sp.]HEV2347595.1 hypothetical protein [Actinocrinis sp.]
MSRHEQMLLDVLHQVQLQLGTTATAFRELRHTKVLETASFKFNTAGVISRDYPVPYSAVTIVSQSSAKLTAANQPNAGAAPSEGQGTAIVGPYGSGTYNLAGRSLTLYGNPGDYVTITVYACPQTPAAAPGAVAITGTAAVSGSVTTVTPATSDLYTEAPASRTTSGNTATLTWPANVTEAFVGVNVTGFAGGTNVVISLQQQDANGIFQTIASTAALTAVGTAVLAVGPGQTNGVLLRSGGAYRLAWTVTGTFTTLTFQLGVSAR